MAELNRPIYEALVTDEETGMLRISLVDFPAVESNFLAFAKEGEKARLYFVKDEEKRIVRGVVMRADYPILRRSGDYEYFIVFRADTIRAMAEKYLAESRQNAVDEMHNHENVDEVKMVQYFIKDTAAGIAPAGFDDIADGSLFAEFHVLNDEVWAKVKDGTYKGFSLEGAFELVPEEMKAIPKTDTNMSKIKRFKAALAKLLAAFGNVSTDKGVLAWDGDEDLKEGDAVYVEDQEGNREVAPDGDYVTSDAKTIVVADGKVAEIRDPEAEVAPTEEPAQEEAAQEPDGQGINTDKGVLYWLGNEDLKEGDDVFVDAEGEEGLAPAADGEYKTEDGKVIVVVDGKVSEIRDDEAEVSTEDEERAQRFDRIRSAFEESYEEKTNQIVEALRADIGNDNFYIRTAGDDFVVICSWDGEWMPHYFRYAVTWNEDGTANVADRAEVKEMFVPIDYEDPFEKEAEELRAQVETLTAKVAKMSKEPKAKPAHEEAKETAPNFRQTGIKGLDRIASLMGKK